MVLMPHILDFIRIQKINDFRFFISLLLPNIILITYFNKECWKDSSIFFKNWREIIILHDLKMSIDSTCKDLISAERGGERERDRERTSVLQPHSQSYLCSLTIVTKKHPLLLKVHKALSRDDRHPSISWTH